MVKIAFDGPTAFEQPQSTAHFPFVSRTLLDLFLQGELPSIREIEIEPEFGYVGRILYHSGTVKMFRSARVDLNSLGASAVATDKAYTKYFLDQLGYHVPRGKVFPFPPLPLPLPASAIQSFAEEIDHYVSEQFGYPCFVKPNALAQGNGVYKCLDGDDVALAVLEQQKKAANLLLVEEAIPWPDYRVVVLDSEVVACYLRVPLFIVGDGVSTVRSLLLQKQAEFIKLDRARSFDADDPRITRKLCRYHLSFETVLPAGQRYNLHDISNLCAGGEAEDYTERICDFWRSFCVKLVANMGLRFCGVDLACSNLEQPASSYSILELNAFPGLSNYATLGEKQAQVVRALYRRIFTIE